MSQHFLRPSLLAASLALACATPAAWSQAGAATQFYDLPAQPLNATVARIASESGVNVSVDAALIRGRMAPPVRGTYTAEDALRQALAGSGLELARTPSGALTLRAAPAQASPAASRAHAQATTLQQIDVSAAPERSAVSEGSGSYAAAAVTIGKGEQSLKEIPQSVSVVTRQQIEDQKLRTLDEVLQATPGVVVEMGSSHERSFYSRGFEIDTLQYDGVPTRRNSGFNISPDSIAYDRIEVLRGPAGLFNGAGNPGGVVNLVRKRPLDTQRFTAEATVGRWNYRRAGFDFSLPLNETGSVRARLAAAHQQQDHFYDVAESKRTALYGIIQADLAPSTTVGIGIHYEKNDMTPFYGGLPRFNDGRDLGLPRSTYLNAAWSRTNVRSTTLFADLNHNFNSDWKIKVGVTRMREDNNDLSGSNYGTVDPATNTGPTISSFRQRLLGEQTGLDATLQGRFQAFGRNHEVRIGANYLKRDYDLASQLYTVANPGINPFTFNPYDYAVAPTVPARAATHTLAQEIQSGLYGSLKWSLTDPLNLIVGARTSRWKSSTRNLVSSSYNTAPYSESGEVSPYAALTYDLDPVWTAYVSYAEIFRSQANLYTASGERLKPATGDTVELGIKGSLLDNQVNAALALFRTIESNRSYADPDNPRPCAGSPTGAACYLSDGKVRSQGLDAEVSGRLLPGLMVAGGYTYNETKYLRDAANLGQPLLSFTPRHILRLWATYQLPGEWSAWTVSAGVNMQSKAYKTSGNIRIEQGGYSVWSARVGYRINRNLTAALNVNNIFDKTYYRTLGSVNGGNWYGEPLNVMATFQATF